MSFWDRFIYLIHRKSYKGGLYQSNSKIPINQHNSSFNTRDISHLRF